MKTTREKYKRNSMLKFVPRREHDKLVKLNIHMLVALYEWESETKLGI
jgi:hypothetical protein